MTTSNNMYRNLIKLLLTLPLAFFLSSCVKETITSGYDFPDGKRVNVTLTFAIAPAQEPQNAPASRSAEPTQKLTKATADSAFIVSFDEPQLQSRTATRSDGTTPLYNLWIFQFNANGTPSQKPYKITEATTSVNDMVILDVPLTPAKNQTLYLVALGPKLDKDLSSVATLADLEALELDYLNVSGSVPVSKITSDNEIPFAGSFSGVEVLDLGGGEKGLVKFNTPSGFDGAIPIKRLLARITLNYQFSVPTHTLAGFELNNVPLKVKIKNPTGNTALTSTDVVMVPMAVATTPNPDGYYSVSWYVAQNSQGDKSTIANEKDRYYNLSKTPPGDAPQNGIYIDVYATKTTDVDSYAFFQIFVGSNNASNFDVMANSAYNLRTSINVKDVDSQSAGDGRVRAYTARQFLWLVAANKSTQTGKANTTGFDPPSGVLFCLDAHPDMRPIVIETKGSEVTVGIYTDALCTTLAPADAWLRISAEPNYTAAYKNTTEPLSNQISRTATPASQLRFYLYSDEYISFDTAPSTTENTAQRTLYVKATTMTIPQPGSPSVIKQSRVFTMTQLRAQYAGPFGGKIVKNLDGSSSYESALFIENRAEYKSSFDIVKQGGGSNTDGLSGHNTLSWGYNNVNFAGHPSFDPNNGLTADNGFTATKYLAENPENRSVNASSNFDEPTKTGGVIDMYQYINKRTYAARYCYDLNRDENGDGEINNGELKWYLPAIRQANGITAFLPSNLTSNTSSGNPGTSLMSTTVQGKSNVNVASAIFDGNIAMVTRLAGGATRCVREVPFTAVHSELQSNMPKVVEVTDRGNSYVGIQTSGYPDAYTRVRDALVVNSTGHQELYREFGVDTGDGKLFTIYDYLTPFGATTDAPQYRVKRFIPGGTKPLSYTPNDKVSACFIISPTDVSATGALITGTGTYDITWAEACGWAATENSVVPTAGIQASNRGCPYYRGKDGNDPIGSWRVPLEREARIIMLFEKTMQGYSATTDFTPFAKEGTDQYITTAEGSSGLTTAAYYAMNLSDDFSNWIIQQASNNKNSKANNRLRCVKDVPVPTP